MTAVNGVVEPEQPDENAAVRRALLILVASSSLFGLMAFTAKLASAGLPGSQIAMIRFAIGIVPIVASRRLRKAAFEFERLDLLFYRGFFGGLAVLCYFTAIAHIPIGVATLLNYTSPIFAGFFSWIFLQEPLHRRAAIPLVIAFTGVVLVVQSYTPPGNLFGFTIWEGLALASAILGGAALAATRAARQTERSWAVFASFTIFGFLATAPFGIWQWVAPDRVEWILLVLVGVISIGAQLLMTHAYRWVTTVTAGVIAQLAVIISMILGILFLDEKLTWMKAAGTALAIGGVTAVIASGRRARRESRGVVVS